jgi:hypothetical protein
MTASLDGRAPRFQQQQQQQMQLMQQAQMATMAAMPGMQGMLNSVDPAQAQILHLQLMQAMVRSILITRCPRVSDMILDRTAATGPEASGGGGSSAPCSDGS